MALNNRDTEYENVGEATPAVKRSCASKTLAVFFWIVLVLLFLINVFTMLQPLYERVTTPGVLPGEEYVKVIDSSGRKVTIRTQCMGPGFADLTEPMTDTIVILEVGGGSAGINMIGIQ